MGMGTGTAKAIARTIGALLVVAAAWAPGAALADVEPNNSLFAPEGPIAGGQEISGALLPADANDWYVLYVDGRQQLHLSSPQMTPSGCLLVTLANADGKSIPPDYTTPPGTTRFYVRIGRRYDGCSPESGYSFRVEPAAAVVPGPGKQGIRTAAEPNDTRAEAFGPMAAGLWYFGTLETVNDRDWLSFYTAPGRHLLDVQTVVYGADQATVFGSSSCQRDIQLVDARGRQIDGPSGSPDLIEHVRLRSSRSRKLYLLIEGENDACLKSGWVAQVGPEEAVLSRAQVAAACTQARRARKAAKGKRARRAARRRAALYC